MKKVIALTLLLIVALAVPALGALKVLEASLAAELEGLVRQQIAKERNIDVAKVLVTEAWVRELHNIKTDVYIVITTVGNEKSESYIRVSDKYLLSEKEFQALVADDEKAAPSEPVFRTTSLGAPEAGTDTAVITSAPEQTKSKLPYIAGGIGALLLMGTGVFVFKARLN